MMSNYLFNKERKKHALLNIIRRMKQIDHFSAWRILIGRFNLVCFSGKNVLVNNKVQYDVTSTNVL